MTRKNVREQAAHKYEQVKDLYECHDHRHAVAILTQDYPDLFAEVCDVLLAFRLTQDQVKQHGGNESEIPKTFSAMLRPLGWVEQKLTAKWVVGDKVVSSDTHMIDYVKGDIALDLEWNSKDQTFDRDLYAFRAFFDCHKICVGLLVTRSDDLDSLFSDLGAYIDRYGTARKYKNKYGASTTHMGKLLPRLEAGRGGGCPVLAIGITRKQVEELNEQGSQNAPE